VSFALTNNLLPGKVFLTSRAKLEKRWDPNYYRWMKVFRAKVKNCPHPVERLKPSLGLVQYGISERATEEPVGVPMLRMINLQADTWDISDMKYIAMSDEDKKHYLLKQGDILFNRTNSKELVGKCCVFNLPGEYVFASYLIRVRLKQRGLLPDYVTAYLASPVGRVQIDAVSRQIAGMTNINAEEIRDLFIPVPDRTIQDEVASSWRKAILRRDAMFAEARAVLAQIDEVLLDELGIKRQPDRPQTIGSRIFRRAFSDVSGGRLDPIANQERRRRLERAIQSSRYPVKHLREAVRVEKKVVDSISPGDTYIGLENINGETGELILTAERESVGTALVFKPGQILFPKLRPYLNKTHLAATGGICSTEFHVFTVLDGDPEYLMTVLRSSVSVGITSLLMTGNTLPRLQMADIERLPIPIPPGPVQERICKRVAAIREKAAHTRAKALAELEAARKAIENLILGSATA